MRMEGNGSQLWRIGLVTPMQSKVALRRSYTNKYSAALCQGRKLLNRDTGVIMNHYTRSAVRRYSLPLIITTIGLFLFGAASLTANAADDSTEKGQSAKDKNRKPIAEVVTTGTQIKGASISEALPVSIVTAEDIELLGIDSGDELLDLIPENGQNFFNEAENISGGVNSARGDTGAFNLRSIGTGNTLVLLNGRRMVNLATYQTEEIGGSFVPVNTVNSNEIPVNGIDELQVLREGASAIYGADAVAGVVNTVLKKDFEGLTVRGKYTGYEGLPRDDQQLSVEWGKFFNGGATNVGVFFNHYRRGRVRASDDPRWANADFSSRVPVNSPWFGLSDWRNDSANSGYGQYDVTSSASAAGLSQNDYTDSAGEFETYPSSDPRCVGGWDLGYGTCGHEDGQGTFRNNLNEFRDLNSKLERTTAFLYMNHDMGNGTESFTEFSVYDSKTNLRRHAAAPFSTVKLRVGPQNYWNPFGAALNPDGTPNPNRVNLPGTTIPAGGLTLEIDNYRFTQLPRIIDNDGRTYRFLQGFRGSAGDLDWETAVLYSKAEKNEVTHNRVSNLLAAEALFDPTPAAFNPFSGGVNDNIERILVDVRRDGTTSLKSFDFKVSNNNVRELPAGPLGMLVGFEWREETFVDDRDPRLDGTIVFTDYQGNTYPYVSDVVNSSPTPDSAGERNVISLFGELQIPILDNLDAQIAFRHENFSDVGRATVPKIAFGWRPVEQLLVRASYSEAFRAPNLVTINEDIVARQNTRTDYTCLFADPMEVTLDCVNSTQRIAQGSKNLEPEKSDNYSLGLVFDPLENLTVTLDFWSIEKQDTIGLFGEENHTILDLIRRLEAGTADCSNVQGNPAVVRDTPDPGEAATYLAAGICPVGAIQFINDVYLNLDKRTVRGHDLGVYYNFDTDFGNFDVTYNGSFLDTFEQEAGGDAAVLVAAQKAGTIPADIPVTGFADLIGQDGNQENRQRFSLRWKRDVWGASLSGYRVGSFYQSSLTLADGSRYVIPAMTTFNGSVQRNFDWMNTDARVRLGINNILDKRAPLADRYFGFFSDAHRDLGRSFYLDLRVKL